MSFKFIDTIASQLFLFKFEIWKMHEVIPFLKSAQNYVSPVLSPNILTVQYRTPSPVQHVFSSIFN